MMKTNPKIGDLVILQGEINGFATADSAPGMITRVHSPTVVNVRVFSDDNAPPRHLSSVQRGGDSGASIWWVPKADYDALAGGG